MTINAWHEGEVKKVNINDGYNSLLKQISYITSNRCLMCSRVGGRFYWEAVAWDLRQNEKVLALTREWCREEVLIACQQVY